MSRTEVWPEASPDGRRPQSADGADPMAGVSEADPPLAELRRTRGEIDADLDGRVLSRLVRVTRPASAGGADCGGWLLRTATPEQAGG